jgi:hypothetical protein
MLRLADPNPTITSVTTHLAGLAGSWRIRFISAAY